MTLFHRSLTALLFSSYMAVIRGAETCQADSIQFTTTDALGPFYVEGSEMTSLIAPRQLLVDPTDVFTVHGKVLGDDCVPLAGARVETWYAGESLYLDDGFRGQVFTDNCGGFQFVQTFPAIYWQRPVPHVHYRISSPAPEDRELLVTQLYFEGALVDGVGSPDDTKVATIVNEPDGSRSAEFKIYVSMPGYADLDACDSSGQESGASAFLDSTMLPSDAQTMLPEDEDFTMMPTGDGTTDGSTTENMLEQEVCGDIVCDPGLVCCNASCGTCMKPGEVCRAIGCVGPTEEDVDVDTDISASKSVLEIFD